MISYPCATSLYNNCYQIADYKSFRNSPSADPIAYVGAYITSGVQVFNPAEAYAIDAKIDDGNAITGAVRDFLGNFHNDNTVNHCDNYDGSNAATATYNMAGNLCYMSIGILSQVPNN